ncbi:MAG: DegT/DnrJ/EryC1/StrS family aminotransferase [Candidatus Saccharicenans sp.]
MGKKDLRIPLIDFKGEYKSIESEIDAAIKEVLLSGQYILGPVVKEFEEEVAAYCGVKHAVGVASGSDALILTLRALGIGPGDEVITTPFTFVATAHAVLHCGARPVFVDIDPETFNINPDLIEPAITARTKAIIPVHLFGHPADMDPITRIARKFNLYVIEDAAQAFGASYKGRKVGSLGDVGCFSFFPTKNLGCYGDGGMVVTDNPEIAEKLDILRRQGCRQKYHAELLGYNSRLDSIQAAILKVKLKYVDQWNEKRRQVAHNYNKLLADSGIKTPKEAEYAYHVYHQYTIRSLNRDEVRKILSENGIEAGIYYPVAVHKQKAYASQMTGVVLEEAEQASEEVLSLPIWPGLDLEKQKEICSIIYVSNRNHLIKL